MEVDFAILADSAQVINNRLYTLGGGWTIIWSKDFPNTHRASVAVGFRVSWNETNQKHSVAIDVRGDDGDLVQGILKAQFETGRPPGLTVGSDQIVMLSANVDFKLEAVGEYAVVIEIDGAEIKRIPYRVVQMSQTGQMQL